MALQTLPPEYESVNPADGATLKTFAAINDDQLEKKIATAQACYETWRHKSYAERAVIVAKAAELMHAHFEDFARLATPRVDMNPSIAHRDFSRWSLDRGRASLRA
jgi:acyl-CoA reductase-like NAD-dependent aldehyde dehydrogenase